MYKLSVYFPMTVRGHYFCCCFLEPSDKEPHKAWEFCAAQSRKVEIVYVDEESGEEVLTNVHFNLRLEVGI